MDITAVTAALEAAGLPARPGYPGSGGFCPEVCMAAVNLTALDTAAGTAGLTVTVLAPRKEGLAACQSAAGRAAAALRPLGDWSFRGWRYEREWDCFAVELHGAQTVQPEAQGWVCRELQLLMDGMPLPYVTEFEAVRRQDRRLIRPHLQQTPAGITPGREGWSICLKRRLPADAARPEEAAEPFRLEVVRAGGSEIYEGCCWSEEKLVYRGGYTEQVCSGFALTREVQP